MKQINVTKTFLPPLDEYVEYLKIIWDNGQITNQGPLLKQFEKSCKSYLGITDFHFVANGTLALQVALKALNVSDGEVITTPFSYVATTSAILWERCEPIFVDIERDTLCIDVKKIESAITPRTKAILAVHVFGIPCHIEEIDLLAKKYNLKVIYDAAHAFGVKYKGKSLLDYGDISICSFHATKLFHTIEGGCIIAQDPSVSQAIELIKRFGHEKDNHYRLGINAKASEIQAAMGLVNLKYIDDLIIERERVYFQYKKLLPKNIIVPTVGEETQYNYSYLPIICQSEMQLLNLIKKINAAGIFPRRYFYPSLNNLPYLETKQHCPISEDIASRTMCLPLYPGLEDSKIKEVCDIILR